MISEEEVQEILLSLKNVKGVHGAAIIEKFGDVTGSSINEMLKRICGLANGKGGLIIFGVRDEDLEIIGYDPNLQFNSSGHFEAHIQDLCNRDLEPPVDVLVKPATIDSKQLFIVQIFPNTEFLTRIKKSKEIYFRKGSSTRISTPFDLVRCSELINDEF